MSRVLVLLIEEVSDKPPKRQTWYLPLGNNIVHGLGDSVGVVVKSDMSQKHTTTKNERSWVCLVLALNIKTNVSASWLKDGNLTSHVAAGNDTGSTNKTSSDVGQDTAVKVGHHHDIKLLRSADTLHTGIVDNHVVGLDRRVFLANLLDSVSEQTVCKLHNVGLVNASNLFAVVGKCKGKCKLGNALRLDAGDDLEGLDDTRD